ncbi:MAG: FtsB family cell division protein [Terriglobia bacterium]
MKGFEWRSHRVRRTLKALAVLAGAALLARGLLGPNGIPAYLQKRRQFTALQRQIQRMNTDDQALRKEVQGLRSNPATIERHAREDLHMARQHEMIYVFPSQDSDSAAAGVTKRPSNPPAPNP